MTERVAATGRDRLGDVHRDRRRAERSGRAQRLAVDLEGLGGGRRLAKRVERGVGRVERQQPPQRLGATGPRVVDRW